MVRPVCTLVSRIINRIELICLTNYSGSDTNPGAAAGTPGRVPLASQMSRDRTRSRSVRYVSHI